MKKILLGVEIFSFIAILTGISYLWNDIAERGFDGVNYGRVIFPLLFFGIAIYASKSDSKTNK